MPEVAYGRMSVIGIVENGKVSLPPDAKFPSGARVRVESLPPEETGKALGEILKEHMGIFDDLPSDFAHNHDHYIHGAPKR